MIPPAPSERVDPRQLLVLVFCSTFGVSLTFIPLWPFPLAQSATPAVVLAAAAVKAAILLALVHLATHLPPRTGVEGLRAAAGPAVGTALAAASILVWLVLTSLLTRELTSFVHLVLLRRTPPLALCLPAYLSAALLAGMGPEAIARFFEVVTLIEVVVLFPLPWFGLEHVHLYYLQPFLPPAGRALTALAQTLPGMFGFSVVLAFAPYLESPTFSRAWLPALLGWGLTVAGTLITTVGVVGTFGPATAALAFPAYAYIQTVRLPPPVAFLERASLLYASVWTLALLKVNAALLFSATDSLRRLLRLPSRPLAPTAAVALALSFLPWEADPSLRRGVMAAATGLFVLICALPRPRRRRAS